jgi:hypothetical protein
MSSSCIPASFGVVNLYALASNEVEMLSGFNPLCSAKAVSDIDLVKNLVMITAQCSAAASGNWTSALVLSPDGLTVMRVVLDSPIPVNAGDTILLTITLAWS